FLILAPSIWISTLLVSLFTFGAIIIWSENPKDMPLLYISMLFFLTLGIYYLNKYFKNKKIN
ncbi:MAG: hypothetical protein PHY00_04030, partial [Bacilli bacterium]|nr:hypothetical protein [Bacilli bacterium]